jgi:hypothetical protein
MRKEINYDEKIELVEIELNRDNVNDFDKILLETTEDSVDEIRVKYLLHYLTIEQRIWLVNRLHVVLKKNGKAIFTVPYWNSSRAFGDLLIQWPPVTESWFPHLSSKWREEQNKFETRYTCDFDSTWGYGMHPMIVTRNQEYQQHAITFWKEAAQELIATIIKV